MIKVMIGTFIICYHHSSFYSMNMMRKIKTKEPVIPNEPHCLLLYLAPRDSQLSSIKINLYFLQISFNF